MWGSLETVGESTRLMNPSDADKIIASVDAAMVPCSPSQAASFVARLIYAYPQLGMAKSNDEEGQNFKLYTLKLHEAFSVFSAAIGEAIVHGGTGVPSIVDYKPQPSDVVKFGKRLVGRMVDAKTMAQRHKAEARRRELEKSEEAKYRKVPMTEEKRRHIRAMVNSLRTIP